MDKVFFIIKPTVEGACNNPVKICRALNKGPFAKYTQVNINKRKNLITLTIEDEQTSVLEQLANTRLLDNIPIKCFIKGEEDVNRFGVISPISTEVTTEEIMEAIRVKIPSPTLREPPKQVLKVERMKKKRGIQWVDSESVKVTFSGKDIPQAVTIYHSYYKVRPYVAPPLQCYNCQRIGHTAKTCKSGGRCMYCGGSHKRQECTKQANEYSCANCKGDHRANDPICPTYQEAKKIEVIRAKTPKTFNEARTDLKKKDANLPETSTKQASSVLKPSSFKDALSPDSSKNRTISDTRIKDPPISNEYLAGVLKSCLTDLMKCLFPTNVTPQMDIGAAVALTVEKHCPVQATSANPPQEPQSSPGEGSREAEKDQDKEITNALNTVEDTNALNTESEDPTLSDSEFPWIGSGKNPKKEKKSTTKRKTSPAGKDIIKKNKHG